MKRLACCRHRTEENSLKLRYGLCVSCWLMNWWMLLMMKSSLERQFSRLSTTEMATSSLPYRHCCCHYLRAKRIAQFVGYSGLSFFFWTMLRSSLQQWQSWSCAKVVIVRHLDLYERSETSNTANQAKHQTDNPQQPHQHQRGNTSSWPINEKVKQVKPAHAFTTSLQKIYIQRPRLSQPLQHLVVKNAWTLLQWALYLAVSINVVQQFFIAASKAGAREIGSLAYRHSWAHKHIIQKKQKCLNRSYPSTPASRNERVLYSTVLPNVRAIGHSQFDHTSATTSMHLSMETHAVLATPPGHLLQLASSSFVSP